MKTLLASLLLLLPVAVLAQEPPKPQHKLIQFQMAILKRGPKWSANLAKDAPALQKEQVDYVQSLLSSEKAAIVGQIKDESDLVGVYILRTESADEAKKWLDSDPAIAAGHFVAELHPWWAEDVMTKTTTPNQLSTVYLAFLVKGEKWTAEETPQTEELQKVHMANINRLAEMKKLEVAGPFGDDGFLRGIFVFKVNSLEEARSLTMTDPAVQAGRFKLDIHPWLVPDGILP
ncbi:MAG TPA: YciI family protein [Pyrinomonadaceae bacterium]